MELNANLMLLASKERYDVQFEAQRAERLAMGEEEYGEYNFLSANVIEMAKEEVIDLANYAQFIYYKLCMLEEDMKDVGPL